MLSTAWKKVKKEELLNIFVLSRDLFERFTDFRIKGNVFQAGLLLLL